MRPSAPSCRSSGAPRRTTGYQQRLNQLRAAVLGANDGIVSVAATVVGVAGVTTATGPILAAGTAAVVSPVNRIGYMGKDIHVPVGESGFGVITEAVLNKITGIQWGKEEHPWSVPIE